MTEAALAGAGALRRHFSEIIMPLWRNAGFNQALRLPYEALDPQTHAPMPVARYRAMACARQLYVFAHAGDLSHAATLFEALGTRFRDTRHGGWYFSVGPDGTPLERRKDLYTHAFVVFACAAYYAASGESSALQIMRDTAGLIETRFAPHSGDTLLDASRHEDFSSDGAGPLQNPLMHLTEAWLAAHAASGDSAFDTALERTTAAVAGAFLDGQTGCIAELPLGAADNRFEPGHQFEWYSLLRMAGARLAGGPLPTALDRAFLFARQHGVDPVTGGVCAALDAQGACLDATQRIWAQTEYLRALALYEEANAAAPSRLAPQIERFAASFLHPRGWYECKTADGAVTRADLPSTTPYHLATAYAALPALPA
jgi:mannose/cellobiose epimerase-like protein (N-acyl-D-glucosamine 2-epimerase family)